MNTFTETAARAATGAGRDPATRTGSRKYLSFRLGGETYGIDILQVQEVRSFELPTRLAQAEPQVLGIMNLRGVIVPVVDLRVQFAIEPRFDTLTITAVLNVGGRTIGVVVDSVSDVIELAADQIKLAPAFSGAVSAGHITGVATIRHGECEQMLALLDIEPLLSGAASAPARPLTH